MRRFAAGEDVSLLRPQSQKHFNMFRPIYTITQTAQALINSTESALTHLQQLLKEHSQTVS